MKELEMADPRKFNTSSLDDIVQSYENSPRIANDISLEPS